LCKSFQQFLSCYIWIDRHDEANRHVSATFHYEYTKNLYIFQWHLHYTPCAVFFHIRRQFLGTWYSWFWVTCKDGVLSDKKEPKLNLKGIIFWNVTLHSLIEARQTSSGLHSKKSQHSSQSLLKLLISQIKCLW
jgi:hypothetical protein